GGYARPMPPAWMARQAQIVAERMKQADIVISTALIPGRPAPRLIAADVVAGMKPGSVIVDMAAEQGGNCELTEANKTVVKHGVSIIGAVNIPASVPTDSSALYARNLLDFLKLIVDGEGNLAINLEDEIVAACLMTRDGQLITRDK
ncbi:MAG: Re/Si-specific NAD(P)(+) transhydrogenase subunit alpha, partial [Aeromonas sp.]